jgi:cell division protein FtsB
MVDGPSVRGPDPRRRAQRAGARPAAGPRRGVPRQRAAAGAPAAARPRFTGRAAILVLVLALLMVSYASSMRAWADQRHHLASLRSSIATSQTEVDRLTREKKRWNDPAYVRTVAHQRFGWVMPGEIGFQVLDADGQPMDRADSLPSAGTAARTARPLWWQSAWGSVVRAGKPEVDPADVPRPLTRIKAPRVAGGSTGSGQD